MSPRGRCATRDERGFVIVYVLALVAIAMTLGAAALADTLSSRQLTTHDQRVRRAQQAADAGIQAALYQQSEDNLGAAYNFTGGPLGLSTFLDCALPKFNLNLQVVRVSLYASSAGVCPQGLGAGGTPASVPWTAVANHAYYLSEFLSNKQEIGGAGVGAVVEFPEIVSLGCDTSSADCTNSASSVYSRELAIFQPTGPLQAIEGMGTVTINGLSLLGLNLAVAVNGDIAAGTQIQLPALAAALNTNFSLNSNPITSVQATFAAPSITGALISTAHNVITTGFCSPGSPSANCTIKRPPISISTTTCALCATGISGTAGAYDPSNDTFTLGPGGTASFAAGDYVFCNFNATGGTITTNASASTPVRIFILAPNQPPCSSYTYTPAEESNGTVGNFLAKPGINNSLGGLLNNVSSAVDPSGLQIYVQGDGSYDNKTTVDIEDPAQCTAYLLGVCVSATATIPLEGMVVYAPTSRVNLNLGQCLVGVLGACTVGAAGAFAGSIVGDDTTITASAITQDFDLGNYPLYSGASRLAPVEYVQCDNSKSTLADTTADTGGC